VLQAADALLIHERGSVVDMSLPSKLTAYCSAGKPVLAISRSESATTAEVAASGVGAAFAHRDVGGITRFLDGLWADPPRGVEFGRRGRVYAGEVLDAGRGTAKVAAVIRQALDSQATAQDAEHPPAVVDLREVHETSGRKL
jgi:hypothetical protein